MLLQKLSLLVLCCRFCVSIDGLCSQSRLCKISREGFQGQLWSLRLRSYNSSSYQLFAASINENEMKCRPVKISLFWPRVSEEKPIVHRTPHRLRHLKVPFRKLFRLVFQIFPKCTVRDLVNQATPALIRHFF